MLRGQDVDTDYAGIAENIILLADPVEAYQHCGWIVGDRARGGDGYPGIALRAACGDDIHRRPHSCHGLAEAGALLGVFTHYVHMSSSCLA